MLRVWGRIIIIGVLIILAYFYYASNKLVYFSLQKSIFNFSPTKDTRALLSQVDQEVAKRFEYLSKNGNSSCSSAFKDSIAKMSDNAHLQGSCCSPMSLHRYSEQIEGLKRYKNISVIPSDPYDVEVGLAKKLMAYYDISLTKEDQKAYDFAMQNSEEKGPCCCKCWRWFVFGGLGKHLIQEYNFTGEQIRDIWNLSDGCGGEGDHASHS